MTDQILHLWMDDAPNSPIWLAFNINGSWSASSQDAVKKLADQPASISNDFVRTTARAVLAGIDAGFIALQPVVCPLRDPEVAA